MTTDASYLSNSAAVLEKTQANQFTGSDETSERFREQAFAPSESKGRQIAKMSGDGDSVSDDAISNDTSIEKAQRNKVDTLVSLIESLPSSLSLSKNQPSFLLKQSGMDNDPQVKAIMSGVDEVSKNDNHIELKRDSVTHIPLNQDVIKGVVQIKSVDLETLKFDIDFQKDPKQISNISGLDLTFSSFGNERSVAIQEGQLSHDDKGNTVITGMVENPIPATAREFLDIGDRIPVTIKLTPQGDFVAPNASTVIQSAADTTGSSLPGLVLHDNLSDAAEVARFAEKYPKWMNDTVSPILTGLENVIEERQRASNPPSEGSVPSPPSEGSVPLPPEIVEQNAPSSDGKDENTEEPQSGKVRPDAGGDYDKTIKVGDTDRHYLLHVPPNYDGSKPLPMIVALHGMGGNSADFEQRTNLNKMADRDGFIVAYPDSTEWFNQKNWKTWDTNNGIIPPGKHADDIQFLRSVIDTTQKELKVDDKRIYMAGVSNGGMMTMHAAAALSDKLAAVAVISGAMSGKENSPSQPLSVINIHGTNDTVIPIGGIEEVPDSLELLGIPTFKPNSYIADYWKTKDHITGPPIREVEGNEISERYINPKNGAEVEQITVKGGQHTPDDVQKTMDTVVDFFERHPKIAVTPDTVPPANDPPIEVHRPIDPVQRLLDNVEKRGVAGIEADVDKALAAVPLLPDGQVSPADLYNKINSTLHQNFNDPVSSFIKSTEALSKKGEHIELRRSNTASIPLNFKVPGTHGLLNIKDIQVGTTSFDLRNQGGQFSVDNLKGLKIKSSILGQDLTSEVKQVTESQDANGNHTYGIKVSHPLPSFARFLLMQPDDISVKLDLDSTGKPEVINQDQIMNDSLGRNPWFRGVIDEVTDVSNAISHPSFSSAGSVLKDVAITGGTTLLAGRLGLAKLGFALAPAVVHELDW